MFNVKLEKAKERLNGMDMQYIILQIDVLLLNNTLRSTETTQTPSLGDYQSFSSSSKLLRESIFKVYTFKKIKIIEIYNYNTAEVLNLIL